MNKKNIIHKKEKLSATHRYEDLDLEHKVRSNKTLEAKVDQIEAKIFEDIKRLIERLENNQNNPIKEKIISKLKGKE